MADGLDPALLDIYAARGRMPRETDARPPWDYRGWALPYVWALHGTGCGGFPDRWGFYAGGCVGLIPRVEFHELRDGDPGVVNLRAAAELVAREVGTSRAWPVLIDWLAWALGVSQERPLVSPALYATVDLSLWLHRPGDYLGHALAGSPWNPGAFFPTPMAEAVLLAELLPGPVAHDPCCGTGRLLMAASNHALRLSGADVDPLVCRVAHINGAVFAPWMTFPLEVV